MDEHVFDALISEFYLESRERVQQIEQSLLDVSQSAPRERARLLVDAQRELHTLKGNSGMMGLGELQDLAHRLEDEVGAVQAGREELRALLDGVDGFRALLDRTCGPHVEAEGGAEAVRGGVVQESVRVAFAALDRLVDLVSEMVIFRNRLDETLAQGLASLDKEQRTSAAWREVEAAHQALGRTLHELQGGIMELRMVPLGTLFAQLRRIVFDESSTEGKEAELSASGGDTPLDKALLEVASEAMGHLVRNAVIHGIESPDAREERGKPRRGQVAIRAAAHGEEVVVDIEDDGRGIDRAALLAAARREGMEAPEDIELGALIALPGLTTREAADRSAGRGMGMAAVMESVRRRGGHVETFSVPGRGTRFRLRLPLTAAILRALLVDVDGESYALPLAPVQETVALAPGVRHTVNKAGVLKWRGQLVPLLDLGVAFGTSARPRREGLAILVESEGRLRGLVVDAVTAIQDVVVKPLDDVMGSPPGLAGSTILGDGRVILLLEPGGLATISPILEQAS